MSRFLSIAAAAPFALLAWHLLGVARRSGAVSDRLLAALFLTFAVGTPPRILAADLLTSGAGATATVLWLNSGANLVIGIGITCLAAFTWKVFRPEEDWARHLVALFAATVAAISLWALIGGSAASGSGPAAVLFDGTGALAFGWAFIECVLYYQRMRRRRSLGLADAVVVNRFFLWSLWTGSIGVLAIALVALRTGLSISGAGALLAAGKDPGEPWIGLISAARVSVAILAPAVVVAVWLSFSPPVRYRNWLAGGAASDAQEIPRCAS